MEKISNIVKGSHRTSTVDASLSQPVRPGAPTFGRPENKRISKSAIPQSEVNEDVASEFEGDRVSISSRKSGKEQIPAKILRESSREATGSRSESKVSKGRDRDSADRGLVTEKERDADSAVDDNKNESTVKSSAKGPDPKVLAKMKEQANLRMIGNLSSKFFERNYVEVPAPNLNELTADKGLRKESSRSIDSQNRAIDGESEEETARAIRDLREDQPRSLEELYS